MRHIRDFEQAFRDAAGNGEFEGKNINDWMYMHSEGIQDSFKNINTREYFTTNYEREI